jgi:hypothetical protein
MLVPPRGCSSRRSRPPSSLLGATRRVFVPRARRRCVATTPSDRRSQHRRTVASSVGRIVQSCFQPRRPIAAMLHATAMPLASSLTAATTTTMLTTTTGGQPLLVPGDGRPGEFLRRSRNWHGQRCADRAGQAAMAHLASPFVEPTPEPRVQERLTAEVIVLEVSHVMLLRCVSQLSGGCVLFSHRCHA